VAQEVSVQYMPKAVIYARQTQRPAAQPRRQLETTSPKMSTTVCIGFSSDSMQSLWLQDAATTIRFEHKLGVEIAKDRIKASQTWRQVGQWPKCERRR
jgi:hypothetical protein